MSVNRRQLLLGASAAGLTSLLGCGLTGVPNAPQPQKGIGKGPGLRERRKLGNRPYWVFHPKPRSSDPMPLVVGLHGGGSEGSTFGAAIGIRQATADYPAIVVLPDAITSVQAWNSGFLAVDERPNDVKFIRKLVNQAISDFNVNEERIYAMGFSSGAHLCYRLAAEASEVFAAIAVQAGCMGSNAGPGEPIWRNDPGDHGARPTSIYHIHGTRDNLVPADGEPTEKSKKTRVAFREALDTWVAHNGTKTPIPRKLPKDTLLKSERGDEGTRVWGELVTGQGHHWMRERNQAFLDFLMGCTRGSA